MAPVLVWTVCAYRKPGMSEEDYHTYASEVHGPLVKELMAKYGMLSFSMSHNTAATRKEMEKLFDPQFANVADYDCIVQATFPDVDCFVRMKADPEYIAKCIPDHENFADTKRSKMTIGWMEHHVRDGQAVY
ncbi:hypothetical protein K458DRAFT_334211 [Lentithecium fluviatile CBS 122367]|uniref:EthD domain-containing protein n=1 Tax=Lentithecium fluviatile CBS 122367 TaxID=1168545 RepID=A0A6G1J7I8_9PLEO|nr:hypothetical protein K458DRAFT_334211 [Lentithecium fluviatile CBS 122367]